jgi:hypothetical protein
VEQIAAIEESPSNSTAGKIIRYSVYTVGILLLMFSLSWLAQQRGAAGFKENGPIEWAQLIMIVFMGLIFLRESFVTRRLREIFIILACFLAFVAIREMDSYLDRVPWVSWKYGYALILYAGLVGYSNFQSLKIQVAHFINFRAFLLLWAGFIIAMPFAQLIGNGDFLQAIVATDYSRDYKRVIEEVGELMGYLLMFIGSVEVILETRAVFVPVNLRQN